MDVFEFSETETDLRLIRRRIEQLEPVAEEFYDLMLELYMLDGATEDEDA